MLARLSYVLFGLTTAASVAALTLMLWRSQQRPLQLDDVRDVLHKELAATFSDRRLTQALTRASAAVQSYSEIESIVTRMEAKENYGTPEERNTTVSRAIPWE